MLDFVVRLQNCSDLQSVLNSGLFLGLELTGADLGNVQLMNWKTGSLTIVAQRGFNDDFLSFFRLVTATCGSACGRAIKEGGSGVIEDVLLDGEFAPYRTIALEAGFRAVQSTPLISSSGAFLGVVSTHFPATHRPSEGEMRALKVAGELTANAIIYQRARARIGDRHSTEKAVEERIARTRTAVERSLAAVKRSYELLGQIDRRLKQRASNCGMPPLLVRTRAR